MISMSMSMTMSMTVTLIEGSAEPEPVKCVTFRRRDETVRETVNAKFRRKEKVRRYFAGSKEDKLQRVLAESPPE